MFQKYAFLALFFLLAGCASPKPQPLILSQAPTFLMPQFQINQATALMRLERAKLECEKLGDLYQAVMVTTDVERLYMKDRADKFLCEVKSQKNVTSLELRSIQSRLFKTSSSNLTAAINTFIKDNGGVCGSKSQQATGIGIQYGVGGARLKDNEIECRNQNKHFNIELDQVTDGNVVRARIYIYSAIRPSVQLTDPKEYSFFFKQIADQLFIEAIQINPAEIR